MPASVAATPLTPTRPSFAARLWSWLAVALTVAHERRGLAALDDHLLADIGLDRFAVQAELRRPFWDLPPSAWPH